MSFTFVPLDRCPDALLIRPTRHGDDRGWFAETFKRSAFVEAGISAEFRQDNHSFSSRVGTLRGLHFQVAPLAQGKLVRVIEGAVYDVVVDIRPGLSFGRWTAIELTADEPVILWVPDGFAHGFQSTKPNTAVLYKTTAEYSPPHERGIAWDDPTLAIPWPVQPPVLSGRDERWPALAAAAP